MPSHTFQRVAVDLNPSLIEARPQLEPRHRLMFWSAIAGIFVLGALSAVNFYSADRATKEALLKEKKVAATDVEVKDTVSEIGKAHANRASAEKIGRWVSTALNTQPFILACLEDLPKEITVESLTLKLTEGQSQIDTLEIVLLGDPKVINQHFEAMSRKLQDVGFSLISPDPIPTSGGVKFRGKFIYKPADQIAWK